MYKVNKEKCIGCGGCMVICPDAIEFDNDGKAEIKSQQCVEENGGEDICPYGAIEKN